MTSEPGFLHRQALPESHSLLLPLTLDSNCSDAKGTCTDCTHLKRSPEPRKTEATGCGGPGRCSPAKACWTAPAWTAALPPARQAGRIRRRQQRPLPATKHAAGRRQRRRPEQHPHSFCPQQQELQRASHRRAQELGRESAQEAGARVGQLPRHVIHLRPEEHAVRQPCGATPPGCPCRRTVDIGCGAAGERAHRCSMHRTGATALMHHPRCPAPDQTSTPAPPPVVGGRETGEAPGPHQGGRRRTDVEEQSAGASPLVAAGTACRGAVQEETAGGHCRRLLHRQHLSSPGSR